MKIERSKSKSGLFLMELIIAIVFFSIASAVCIQLFVQAHLANKRSADISTAVTLAQNYAEEFKAVSQEAEQDGAARYYGYDGQGQLIRLPDGSGASFVLQADIRQEDESLEVAEIAVSVWKEPDGVEGDVLCALDVRRVDLY